MCLFTVMERVLSKIPHKLGALQMHVAAYYDCLGVLPPGLDTMTPSSWVQSCVEITDADQQVNVLQYYNCKCGKVDSCLTAWDSDVDTLIGSRFAFCMVSLTNKISGYIMIK